MPDIHYPRFYGAVPWQNGEDGHTTPLPKEFFDHVETWLESVAVQANIGAGAVVGGMVGANNLSDVASKVTSLATLGGRRGVTLEAYGVTMDGTRASNSAKIQQAIDDVNAAGGGVIWATPGSKIFLDANVTLKQGVWIDGGGGSKQTQTKQSVTFIADHTLTGFIFDTPNTAFQGCGIRCCYITTDMNPLAPGSNILGGIRFQKVTFGQLEHVIVSNVTDTAFKIAGGTGNILSDLGGSYIVAGRTLTQPTGVMHVNGTDHMVEKCEMFAGTVNTITYPGLWQCGYYVNCLTSWFVACEGEFAEAGWYIDGPQSGGSGLGTSGAYLCRWLACRATYNAGHGFYVAGAASYNEFVAPYVYNCSQAGDGLYDGFFLANGSIGTRIGKLCGGTNTLASQGGSGAGGRFNLMRYLYNDQNAVYVGDLANKIDEVWMDSRQVAVDVANVASVGLPVKSHTGAFLPRYRPGSRHVTGRPFFDTTLNKELISNGVKWIDHVGGKLTQINQIPIATAENRQPAGATGTTSTTGWHAQKGTLSTVLMVNQNATIQTLAPTSQLLKVVADAAAVTAGQVIWDTTGLTLAVDPTQDLSVGIFAICGAGSGTGTLSIAWYDAGATLLGQTTGLGSTAVGNAAFVKITATVLAATIAGFGAVALGVLSPVITKGSMVAGTDSFFATQAWWVQGAQVNYVAP